MMKTFHKSSLNRNYGSNKVPTHTYNPCHNKLSAINTSYFVQDCTTYNICTGFDLRFKIYVQSNYTTSSHLLGKICLGLYPSIYNGKKRLLS